MSEIMTGTVHLEDGLTFRATSGSGHDFLLDGTTEAGGGDRGPRPLELLLLGLGGCTGMDVISILRKMRQDVTGYEVQLHGVRADEHPKVFTTISVEHVVRGRNLSVDAVRRAVDLSAHRYCSAAAMLGRVAQIDETFRVVDEATGEEVTGALAAAA